MSPSRASKRRPSSLSTFKTNERVPWGWGLGGKRGVSWVRRFWRARQRRAGRPAGPSMVEGPRRRGRSLKEGRRFAPGPHLLWQRAVAVPRGRPPGRAQLGLGQGRAPGPGLPPPPPPPPWAGPDGPPPTLPEPKRCGGRRVALRQRKHVGFEEVCENQLCGDASFERRAANGPCFR